MSERGSGAEAGPAVAAAAARDAAGVAALVDAGGEELRADLEAVERELLAVAAEYDAGVAAPARATIAAGGKRLRPLIVLIAAGRGAGGAARAGGRDPLGRALLRAAVAVELVHAATLVHDDVLDGASTRRGRPTVFAEHGRGMATAVGDLLFSRAFAVLARNGDAEHLRILSYASSALARGELLQREDAFDAEVAVERYLLRCECKTARLFDAACRLGVMAGPEPDGGRADLLGAFGLRIGLAFQMLDDVLDVSGPEERTGKPRGADLLDGTVNLPLILARERDPALAAWDLRSIRDPSGALDVCRRIEATGALEEVRLRAAGLVREAKGSLAQDDLPPALLAALHRVADSVVERYA